MPKGYPSLNEIQKSEIINRVTDKGERVPDLAREYGEYGVIPKTIYNLLRNKANQPQAVLELAKFKAANRSCIK